MGATIPMAIFEYLILLQKEIGDPGVYGDPIYIERLRRAQERERIANYDKRPVPSEDIQKLVKIARKMKVSESDIDGALNERSVSGPTADHGKGIRQNLQKLIYDRVDLAGATKLARDAGMTDEEIRDAGTIKELRARAFSKYLVKWAIKQGATDEEIRQAPTDKSLVGLIGRLRSLNIPKDVIQRLRNSKVAVPLVRELLPMARQLPHLAII